MKYQTELVNYFLMTFLAKVVEPLNKEILSYLRDSDDLEKYKQILQEFQNDPTKFEDRFNELTELLEGNQHLEAVFDQNTFHAEYSDDGLEIFGTFLQFLKNKLKGEDIITDVTTAFSFYINELIPTCYFEYRIHELIDQLPVGKRKPMEASLNKFVSILSSHDDSLFRRIRQFLKNDQPTNNFLVSPIVPGNPLYQILVVIDQAAKTEQKSYCLKLLQLIAFKLIGNNFVRAEFRKINPCIEKIFNEIMNNCPKESLFPYTIFDKMRSDLEKQIKWVFSKEILLMIQAMPQVNANTILEDAYNEQQIQKHRKDLDINSTMPYIIDVQLCHVTSIIKSYADCIRNGNLEVSLKKGSIELIIGEQTNTQSPKFYKWFYNKCIKLGAILTEYQQIIWNDGLSRGNSNDRRCILRDSMKESTIFRRLLFTGIKYNLPTKAALRAVSTIARGFIERFDNLSYSYDKFSLILSGGTIDVDEKCAFTMVYFMELSKMIYESEGADKFEFLQIPEMVFQEPSPLANFDNYPIANADIILTNFAKNLKQAIPSVIEPFTNPFDKNNPKPLRSSFGFNIQVSMTDVYIKGYINSFINLNL